MNKNEIMVSVWGIAYNHENYIRDAIEGFLNQKTSFKYEIVIHDDASTDNTANIIREYEQKYPGLIRGIYQKENQFSKNLGEWNGKKPLMKKNLKGKYIAICECDDCWIDRHKLQIQFDYLESHPECMMISHNALCHNYEANSIKPMNPYNDDKIISAEELIIQYNGNIPTASTMYRHEMLEISGFFLEGGVGDYPLELYCQSKGTVYYIDRIMSLYRYKHNGSWCKTHEGDAVKYCTLIGKIIWFLKRYNRYTENKFEWYISYKIQLYLNAVLMKYKELSYNSFNNLCDRCNECDNAENTHYYSELKRIYVQLTDEKYCDDKIRKFSMNHSHIVIWGAGEYGKIVAKQLEKNEIDFKGFVISDNQKKNEQYMKKPVWNLINLPYKNENIGIIVAVDVWHWRNVRNVLKEMKGLDYIYPFGAQGLW